MGWDVLRVPVPLQPMFVLSFVIAVTWQRAVTGPYRSPYPFPCMAPPTSPPPPLFFLYPFRVENLYLLWECNLFLMDNVTLSGAGSWVS